jgi:glycosyltransferase involved in cell wall biosynthesis
MNIKSKNQKILVAIPCYNCENQISRVLSKIVKSKVCREKIEKIIIFDNQSQDQTQRSILKSISTLEAQDWVTCFLNEKNYGLGGTQKLAFKYAFEEQYTSLIIIHGDDQASIEDLENMLIQHSVDASSSILGARFMPGSKLLNYSKVRIFGNLAINQVYSLFCSRKIFDIGSGLNIFKVSDKLMQNLDYFSDGFSFNMDLLLFLLKEKSPIRYFPISWSEIDQVSNAKNINIGMTALKTLFKWKFGKQKRQSDFFKYRFKSI